MQQNKILTKRIGGRRDPDAEGSEQPPVPGAHMLPQSHVDPEICNVDTEISFYVVCKVPVKKEGLTFEQQMYKLNSMSYFSHCSDRTPDKSNLTKDLKG